MKRNEWMAIIATCFLMFASRHGIIHVDYQDMKGVDCYCDEEARKEIHHRLASLPTQAIHFIDSGDFHYLTEYWVSRLNTPFSLIVFNHHPDMQQPQWEGVVSCGGWVSDVLRKIHLSKISSWWESQTS